MLVSLNLSKTTFLFIFLKIFANTYFSYAVPPADHFNKIMDKLNIFEDNRVVIYNSISAAKAWFIFNYFGHPDTKLLDGGLREWSRRNYPINTFKSPMDYTDHPSTTFRAKDPQKDVLADLDHVIAKMGE